MIKTTIATRERPKKPGSSVNTNDNITVKELLNVLNDNISVFLIYGRWFAQFENKRDIPSHILDEVVAKKSIRILGINEIEIRIKD